VPLPCAPASPVADYGGAPLVFCPEQRLDAATADQHAGVAAVRMTPEKHHFEACPNAPCTGRDHEPSSTRENHLPEATTSLSWRLRRPTANIKVKAVCRATGV